MEEPLISDVSVSLSNSKGIDNSNNLISISAKQFLKQLADFESSKRVKAKYDNKMYYIPYFSNYFLGIEKVIKNISKMASKSFEGYFIVVNNTARNFIIPVDKSVIDVFSHLGFKAEIQPEFTRELSHFGAINPVVKGFKARHMEYAVKIWRD